MKEYIETFFATLVNLGSSILPSVMILLSILDSENSTKYLMWALLWMYFPVWYRRFDEV